jgi:hypothetical protein
MASRVNNRELATKKEAIYKQIEKKTALIEKKIVATYKESMDRISVKFEKYFRKIEKEGLTVNNISAIQRLRSLYQDIFDEMRKIEPKVYKWVRDNAEAAYKKSYYENFFVLEKQLSLPLTFNRLNAARVRAIVKTPFPGTTLEQLIVTVKQRAFAPVKFELAVGQALGAGPKEIAREMLKAGDIFKAQYSNAAYNALRIARTESLRAASYAHEEMSNEAAAAGVKFKKQWVSTLDDRTREDHIIMDGNFANDDGYFELPDGTLTLRPRLSGVAEQDINCRCSSSEFVEGISRDLEEIRASSDMSMTIDGKQVKYSSLNYEKWREAKGIKE